MVRDQIALDWFGEVVNNLAVITFNFFQNFDLLQTIKLRGIVRR
jgi:hypothetical protein